VEKSGIAGLAMAAREAVVPSSGGKDGEGKGEAEKWLEGYEPHVSLL
jgi:hypothetical protein